MNFPKKLAEDGTFAVFPSLFYQFYTMHMHGVTEDTTCTVGVLSDEK